VLLVARPVECEGLSADHAHRDVRRFRGAWKNKFDHRGAEIGERGGGGADEGLDLRIEIIEEEVRREPDAHANDTVVEPSEEGRRLDGRRRGDRWSRNRR
jgi:hypothetical protein